MVLFLWYFSSFCKIRVLLNVCSYLLPWWIFFTILAEIQKNDIKFFENISTQTKISPRPLTLNSFILWKRLLCLIDSLSNILSFKKKKDFKLENPSPGYSSRQFDLLDHTIGFLPPWFYSLVWRNKLTFDDI